MWFQEEAHILLHHQHLPHKPLMSHFLLTMPEGAHGAPPTLRLQTGPGGRCSGTSFTGPGGRTGITCPSPYSRRRPASRFHGDAPGDSLQGSRCSPASVGTRAESRRVPGGVERDRVTAEWRGPRARPGEFPDVPHASRGPVLTRACPRPPLGRKGADPADLRRRSRARPRPGPVPAPRPPAPVGPASPESSASTGAPPTWDTSAAAARRASSGTDASACAAPRRVRGRGGSGGTASAPFADVTSCPQRPITSRRSPGAGRPWRGGAGSCP